VRARRRQAIGGEGAFTLVELLVVINIIGILTLLAAPSYLSFRDRSAKAAAKANVRNASEAISAYYQDNQSYLSMTATALKSYDAGLAPITIVSKTASAYCIVGTVRGWPAYKSGPGGDVTTTACS
jgi:type IV pilus assembly protein PilE